MNTYKSRKSKPKHFEYFLDNSRPKKQPAQKSTRIWPENNNRSLHLLRSKTLRKPFRVAASNSHNWTNHGTSNEEKQEEENHEQIRRRRTQNPRKRITLVSLKHQQPPSSSHLRFTFFSTSTRPRIPSLSSFLLSSSPPSTTVLLRHCQSLLRRRRRPVRVHLPHLAPFQVRRVC